MFCGEYIHPVDPKGRVVFDKRFRGRLLEDEVRQGFYLTRGFDGSLLIFPKQEWDEGAMANKVASLPLTRGGMRKFKRMFFSVAVFFELDKQGRVMIPEAHRRRTGIDREALFIGVGKHVEIWDPDRYRAYNEEEDSPSYEELAEEILYGETPAAVADERTD